MKSIFEQMGGTYTQVGDYFIPDLSVTEEVQPIGKYGRMRKEYLESNKPGLYNRLILSGELYEHLAEVERTCNERLEIMIPRMVKLQGITEELKARDQFAWVGRMNEIKHSAEEIILEEIVYE